KVRAQRVDEHDQWPALGRADQLIVQRHAVEPGKLHQNGYPCLGSSIVIQRSSVNSSIAALPPNRPKPDPLTPPNGICASSLRVGPLMWQMPASICCATRNARWMSRLNTADDSPYSVSLAMWIASASSLARITDFTGPNDSSL